MPTNKQIIGRQNEIKKLEKLTKSKKSEFAVIYGRRRVGKTFLIREHFNYTFSFYLTGLANADTNQQLFNFDTILSKTCPLQFDGPTTNWLIAFQRLITHIESIKTKEKKVIFIDELPWLDTHGSDFLIGLENFWNHSASARKDILFIACGSATSWMINELINNTGGLHNRVTQKMKINPFNLYETEALLQSKKCVLDRYQITQLYMTFGGIPYYLDAIDAGKSATQNIQDLLFDESALLKNEYFNLYRSLFKKYEVYEKIVEALSTKTEGMQRSDIIKIAKINSGGTLTKVLVDLEESGFINSYTSLDNKNKNRIYRLCDYYTKFYFQFIASKKYTGANAWLNVIDNPVYRTWMGYAFEQICLDHIPQVKTKLGIQGIQSNNVAWKGAIENKGAQIDLLIDRRDNVINLCECKFSLDTFTIDKAYSEKLRNKISVFKNATQTKSAVFMTMITTYGVTKNQYADMLVQNEVKMDDLFMPIV
jgi:uncharacterized protein